MYPDKKSFSCTRCEYRAEYSNGIINFNTEKNTSSGDYSPDDLRILYNAEASHFWFLARKKYILSLFNKHVSKNMSIIEIGAGTGDVSRMLIDNGYDVSAGELYTEGLEFARSYGLKKLYCFDLRKPPFMDHFDAVGLFDVLEHIEDDTDALINIRKVLKPGGTLVMTVPAYKWLWHEGDVKAGHKRRYTRKGLNNILKKAGYRVHESKYFFSILLPLLFMRKLISIDTDNSTDTGEIEPVNPVINNILYRLLLIENSVFQKAPLPFGGSISIVAEKI